MNRLTRVNGLTPVMPTNRALPRPTYDQRRPGGRPDARPTLPSEADDEDVRDELEPWLGTSLDVSAGTDRPRPRLWPRG